MSANQTETKENYHSDSVQLTIEEKPACVVEFHVKASPSLTKNAYKKAIRTIAKEVSIPGFRKGKAPDQLIEKRYKHPLEEKWKKEIADQSFKEAQNLAKISVLNTSNNVSFDLKSHSKEEGAEMTFSFEREPEIPKIDPKKISLESVDREEIDEKKVNETIDQIREFFGEWVDMDDQHAIQENDFVTVDVENIENDPPEMALNNTRFKVSRERMAKWMHDLIIGMKQGESKDGVSTPDEDAPEEVKKDSPPKKVRVHVRQVQQQKLPEINDEFALKVGCKSADEMKENLNSLLNKRSDNEVRNKLRDQVADALIEKFPFEIPSSLIERENNFRMKQLAQDPQYKNASKEKQEEMVTKAKQHAERSVKLFYLCRKICEDNKIRLDPAELNPNINSPLEAMFADPSQMYNAQSQSQEQQAIALSRLMLSKAEDFVIDKVQATTEENKK